MGERSLTENGNPNGSAQAHNSSISASVSPVSPTDKKPPRFSPWREASVLYGKNPFIIVFYQVHLAFLRSIIEWFPSTVSFNRSENRQPHRTNEVATARADCMFEPAPIQPFSVNLYHVQSKRQPQLHRPSHMPRSHMKCVCLCPMNIPPQPFRTEMSHSYQQHLLFVPYVKLVINPLQESRRIVLQIQKKNRCKRTATVSSCLNVRV